MSRTEPIGFSQRIRLEWLDYAANLVLSGNPRQAIVTALDDRLQDTLSVGSQVERGNRHKAISILMKVWVNPPPELHTLRDAGLALLRNSDPDGRMLIHWGMCMAVYPFFGSVAAATGRVLRLQSNVRAAQVQRRLREKFGQRETVARAARRVLRLFVDWGVLLETNWKGLYCNAPETSVDDPKLVLWVCRAALAGPLTGPQPINAILRGPHLFPFELASPAVRELEACESLGIIRHGIGQDVLVGADTAR